MKRILITFCFWAWIGVTSDKSAALSLSEDATRKYNEATRLFKEGLYLETLEKLHALSDKVFHTEEVLFLAAYAYFKLDNYSKAEALLDSINFISHHVQVSFLRGLIAYRKKDFRTAIDVMVQVKSSEMHPWADSAAALLETLIKQEEDERKKNLEILLKKKEETFWQHIEKIKAYVMEQKFQEAKTTLTKAMAIYPEHGQIHYYEGYIYFKEKQFRLAQAAFSRAIQLDPTDGWSQYMLALSYANGEKKEEAIRTLRHIIAISQIAFDVKENAKKALKYLALKVHRKETLNPWNMKLEVGFGLDTNPAYVSEVSNAEGESNNLGSILLGSASYRHVWNPTCEGAIGVNFFDHSFLLHGESAEETDLGAETEIMFAMGNYEMIPRYAYQFSLYGHAPLLSSHVGQLEIGYLAKEWLRFSAYGGVEHNTSLHGDFRYLGGYAGTGGFKTQIHKGRFYFEGIYELKRNFSSSVETEFLDTVTITTSENEGTSNETSSGNEGAGSGTSGGTGGGSGASASGSGGSGSGGSAGTSGASATYASVISTQVIPYRLATNYTSWIHSVYALFHLTAFWKLSLSLGGGVLWRNFDWPDTMLRVDTGEKTALSGRGDFQVGLDADINRSLPKGFSVGIVFKNVHNFSTVDSSDTGLNRNYSRQLVNLYLRWNR